MDPHGPLRPTELSFLAESTPITIIPRQRLEPLPLITCPTPRLLPPQRATLPLWLALLLKSQKRCNIVPPAWLSSHNIAAVLAWEHEHPNAFSPALPWHWFELSQLLLEAAADDFLEEVGVGGGGGQGGSGGGDMDLRVLLRGLREIRQAKAREGLKGLEGTFLFMNGLGAMEICELRGFAGEVVDGLRRLGATREEMRREEEERERDGMEVDEDEESLAEWRSGMGRSSGVGRSSVGRSSVAVRGSGNGGGSIGGGTGGGSSVFGRSEGGFDEDAF